ncbi:MAG: hypothetical protein EOP13_15255 [Pseudomonas sp.]|uniref:hypothetical protein n=1 Tax=Pseudomonas sp. TaxID=306 RepID=UPI0011FD9942|nr:hypothetical protein [Pseudomonas sp.]RZI72371.1 MAG: hypothetical protein EOP13_15255 [Pseudomonas sp.]
MTRGTLFHAYLKVELQSRFPKIWVWKIRQNDSDELVQRSDVGFNNADDAWFAGSRVLAGLEAQHPARQLLQQAA